MTDNPKEYVTRSEYEQFVRTYEVRHSELRLEIKEIEADNKAHVAMLSNKIDGLGNQIQSRGSDIWKMLATSALSFISGFLLQYATHFLGK